MRVLVLADVHANEEALRAVLAHARQHAVDAALCLGDVVGYGPRPVECIELLREARVLTVMGNHDRDAAGTSEAAPGTRASARLVLEWTRTVLRDEHRAWLLDLPRRAIPDDALVGVHGCYLNPSHITGYVTSTMMEANLRAILEAPDLPKVGLCGHTHQPNASWLTKTDEVVERTPTERVEWPASARAVLVNPGSVGQPRDRDPRASYAVLDVARRFVEVHRVPYAIERTIAALNQAGLPPELGERLKEGA